MDERTRRGRASSLLVPAVLLAAIGLPSARAQQADSGRLNEEMIWLVDEDPLVDAGSKRQQHLSRSPVNVQVFTAEQIRASGARNLGEFLRRVPSVRALVATSADTQVNAARAASVTGFQFVEVLLDGRSVRQDWLDTFFETPLPILLVDIDRIEVVQGPDGAIYGPGGLAMVIDIKTRDPADQATQGTLVQVAGGGPTGLVDVTASEGFGLGAVHSKVTANFSQIDEFAHQTNVLPDDDETSVKDIKVAMRNVLDQEDGGRWELDGSYTTGDVDLLFGTVFKANDASERSALIRNERGLFGGQLMAQASWTEFAFGLQGGALDEPVDNTSDRIDAEIRETFDLETDHHLLVGLAYKFETVEGGLFADRESLDNLGLFASDEWQITDELSLSASARAETLNPAGTVFIPGGALVWKPSEHHSFRLGVGRGLAAPPLFGLYGRFDVTPLVLGPGPVSLLLLRGNPDLDYQELTSYEAGYRGAFWDGRVYTHVEGFVEDVRKIVGFGPLLPEPPVNVPFVNRYSYWAAGTESSIDVKPYPWLTLGGEYAFIAPYDNQDEYGHVAISKAFGQHRGVASVDFDFRVSQIPAPWMRGWRGLVSFEATSDGTAFPVSTLTAGSLVQATSTLPGSRLLNARLGWELASYHLEVALEGWNLLDQELPIWGRGNRIVDGRVTIQF